MFYLNTTRHLVTPADDSVIARLVDRLDSEIGPKAESLDGLRSISWMVSLDRMTIQAFSGWDTAEDLPRAQNSTQHRENGLLIADLLGGLASPQEHSQYQLISSRKLG
ncbi:hypothetical protein [Actinoallomurus iriomotensis]|jgi:hypothetical protein|uniref:ABM domain-containing protein n=1 Tax=Actinoallomurus iriomotensis TaxID=478107 RepID=A0A9W6VXF0_9ACTN|nr:hypothetical protein [Actinoallomurus iriomotensis]GLY88868.1 hypothetical protein Airi02_067970 [Actinoallomurus iriomotensis]